MNRTRPRHALSDVSATEFLTLGRAGFYPHGLVVGVAVYDAGFTGMPMNQTSEVIPIGVAMHSARAAAIERMIEQAVSHQAEGVVGVRLEVEHHVWHGGHTVVRFEAIGTAVGFDPNRAPIEHRDAPPLLVRGRPFTSALAGQDFVNLLRAGYRPVTVAMGSCVYEVSVSALSTGLFSSNEIPEYTQAFMTAREVAMQRLARDLFHGFPPNCDSPPVGVVGMSVDETLHKGPRPLIEYNAIGTAITHLATNDPRRAATLPPVAMVVPVDL